MKKYLFSLICILIALGSLAQDEVESVYKPVSKESQTYHEYRLRNTIPPYGLQKVKNLIAGLEADDDEIVAPAQKIYTTLSLREKFTYHMIHGEKYSQICDIIPPIQDEHKKIMGNLPDDYDEHEWSERQIDWFKRNHDSVVALMKASIGRTKRIGLNFKHAVVQMNALEMIPVLIETYQIDRKDRDILTVLMLLMHKNRFPAFMQSTSCKKLYGEEVDSYEACLQYNKANEELIIKRATEFLNTMSSLSI